MQPLISCLCPTKNHPKILKTAIDCFNNQTYENKELILVTDEKNPHLEILETFVGDNIKLFKAPHGSIMGTLRNISVKNANGEYIATWDDDDIHHKDRLTTQYRAIIRSNKQCCFLKRVLINDTVGKKKGISKIGRAIDASMLALKSEMPKYDISKSIAEDVPIRNFFIKNEKIIIIDEPQLYIHNIHGDNTCEYIHMKTMIDVVI